MKRFYLLVYLLAAVGLARLTDVQAQTTLATFEDGVSETLTFDNTAWYEPSVFKHAPAVYDNSDRNGINSSLRCVGATNVAEQNRYLTFQCYRSAQPKEMRIGFNGYDESNQVWIGRTSSDARWQTMTVDLGAKFMGQSLSSLYTTHRIGRRFGDERTVGQHLYGSRQQSHCVCLCQHGANEDYPFVGILRTHGQTTGQRAQISHQRKPRFGTYPY